MSDTDEPFGQDVQEESAQKLDPIERHHARLVAMCIIAPAEADVLSIEGQQAMIRDGDAVRVAAEIAQHLQRAPKAGLAYTTQCWRRKRPTSLANCLGSLKTAAGPAWPTFFRR